MKRWLLWSMLAGGVCIAGLPTLTHAMKLRSVVGSGGAVATGTRNAVSTLGQPAIGVSQNASMKVTHGFWAGASLPSVAVDDDPGTQPGLPRELTFSPPAPNPTRGRTQFELALPASASIRLSLVDVTGRLVAVAQDGRMEAGRHLITWDGHDARGHAIAPGIYFAKLKADGRVVGRRTIVLMR